MEIWTTARLLYLLITEKVIQLEKILLRYIQNLKSVNILSADDKYSLLNGDNLTQPIQIQFSQKQNFFSPIFPCICEIYIKFWNFSKKRWHSYLMYLRKYEIEKTELDNCLKSPVSGDSSTSNMVNGLQHCWNMNNSIFTISIDHREDNWVGKGLF